MVEWCVHLRDRLAQLRLEGPGEAGEVANGLQGSGARQATDRAAVACREGVVPTSGARANRRGTELLILLVERHSRPGGCNGLRDHA